MVSRPSVVIVTPATAAANNGNWRTAARWARMLRPHYGVRVTQRWPDGPDPEDDLMIALHARRSAAAVQAWARRRPPASLALVLTGTDLYDDIEHDAQARQSLALASRLVVLQELGAQALPPELRPKARVIFQSTTTRRTLVKSAQRLTALMVGHLRDVKDPGTFFEAARLLSARDDLRLRHIGSAENAQWSERARQVETACTGYRWLGPMDHGRTRTAIQRAHVLVHPSRLEGGAHVVMEAVCSGTPVLASRVPGNVGMLGSDYEGYFPGGDAQALARLLERCRDEQARGDRSSLLARLAQQCARRAPLFAPRAEQDAVLRLVGELRPS